MGITGGQTQRVAIAIFIYDVLVTLINGAASIWAVDLLKFAQIYRNLFRHLNRYKTNLIWSPIHIEHILDANACIGDASTSLIRHSAIVVDLNRIKESIGITYSLLILSYIFFAYRIRCSYTIFVLGSQSLHCWFAPLGHHRVLAHFQGAYGLRPHG